LTLSTDFGHTQVIIVWDLYPGWGAEICRKMDCDAIKHSLKAASVAPANVHLVCIEQELETWLIADGRAISSMLSSPNRPLVRINGARNPQREYDPKGWLSRNFRENGRGVGYRAFQDAEKIAHALPDLNKIKKCDSFKRLAKKVADVNL